MNKAKKILSIIMCIALVLSNFTFADNGSDIKGNWAENQINSWLAKGYVKGFSDGSFKPNNEISRIEFVIMINRAFGFTEIEAVDFKDVKANDWFYSEVSKAKKAGYISGLNDGTFSPNSKITRQEAAVILSRLFKLQASSNTEILAALKDASSIPSWSEGAISAVISKGYMQGLSDKSFEPSKIMTRAEAVVALDRCYLDYVKVAYEKAGVYTAGTVDGSLEIKAADVTLQDTVINGNLVISENVGDGNVKLKNVTVKGNTYVRGGGLNSIIAEDSTFKLIIVDKTDNKVRFVAFGNTIVDSVNMISGGKLEEQNLSGSGFGTVIINEESKSTDPVILVGKFESIDVKAANFIIDIEGTIGDLKVDSTAKNTTVNISRDSSIVSLSIYASVTLTGTGKVESAVLQASNIELMINGGNIAKLDVSTNASNTLISLSLQAIIKELIVNALAVVTGNGNIETAQVNTSGTRVDVPTSTVNLGDGVTNVVTYTPPPTSSGSRRTERETPNPSEPSDPSAPNAFIVYSQELLLGVSTTMEYSTDNWATSTDVTGTGINISSIIPAEGNPAATLKIRAKATPSAVQTLTIPARPATPNYAIDFINERINSVASTDEYSDDNFATYVPSGTGADITIHPNSNSFSEKHIYFRKKVTTTSFRSAVQHIVIPTRPSYEGLSGLVTVVPASGPNGTMVTAENSIEIRLIRADEFVKVAWEDGTSDGKDFTTAAYSDIVRTRRKATSTTFAGDQFGIVLNESNCKYVPSATPVISGVTIPDGTYKVGDTIEVTINADNTGYTAGVITVNDVDVSSTFASAVGNSYTVLYTVVSGDQDRATVEAIPISVVLYNESTPSTAYTAPLPTGSVVIDGNLPFWFSIKQVVSTNNEIDGDGKSNVTITWTDSTSPDVDHYEIVAKVGATATVDADVITGMGNINDGVQSATFEWTVGEIVNVGVVAVDTVGNKRITTRSVTVLADAVTTAGAATNLAFNDLDINNDASDLQVQFNAAIDESSLSEYRVMVVPTGSAVSYSLTGANSVPADSYISMSTKTGGTYTVNFGAEAKDVDGNVIHTGTSYSLFILSIADGIKATLNSLSAKILNVMLSPFITTELVPDLGNEAKFKIVGQGDYSLHTFEAGTANLINSDGSLRYYMPIFGSDIYYMINTAGAVPEAGDQIIVTDDGTGIITISVTDGDVDGSLNGIYKLDVASGGFSTYVNFTIAGTTVTIQ